jgi:hypothetical protein
LDELYSEEVFMRLRDFDSPEDEPEEYGEESLTEKIGDCIVDGIHKVADIICTPFEWLTDKIIGRM